MQDAFTKEEEALALSPTYLNSEEEIHVSKIENVTYCEKKFRIKEREKGG